MTTKTPLRSYAVFLCAAFALFTTGWGTTAWAGTVARDAPLVKAPEKAAAPETAVGEACALLPPSSLGTGESDHRTRSGKVSERFPNIMLRTQCDTQVRFYDDIVKDRIVLINFMYTTCSDICPATTQNLIEVYDYLAGRMGRDMLMLSISIDPEVDTPDALMRYAVIFDGPKPGWLFLTGDYAEIDRLRRSLGVYDLDPVVDADKTQHSGILTFGNDRTNQWAALPAMMDSKGLARTILRITRDPKRKHSRKKDL